MVRIIRFGRSALLHARTTVARQTTTLYGVHIVSLAFVILAAPIDLDPLFKELFSWIKGIILAIAGIYFLFDIAKALAQSPKDVKGVGINLLSLGLLLVLVMKVGDLVGWVCTQAGSTCKLPF